MSNLFFNYLVRLRQIHNTRETIELVNYHKPQDLVDELFALNFEATELDAFVNEAIARDIDLLRDEKFIHLIFVVVDLYCCRLTTRLALIGHLLRVFPYYPEPYRRILLLLKSAPRRETEELLFNALKILSSSLTSFRTEKQGTVRYLLLKDTTKVPIDWIEDCISNISRIEKYSGWGPFQKEIEKILRLEILDETKLALTSKRKKYQTLSFDSGREIDLPKGKKNSIALLTVVFGKDYIQRFLRCCKWNFQNGVFDDENFFILIGCSRADSFILRSDANFKKLSQRLRIVLVVAPNEELKNADKYEFSNDLYSDLLRKCAEFNHSAILLPPDVVLASDAIDQLNFGSKIIGCTGVRCDEEVAIAFLEDSVTVDRACLERVRQSAFHSSISSKGRKVHKDGKQKGLDQLLPTMLVCCDYSIDTPSVSFAASQLHPFFIPLKYLKSWEKFSYSSLDSDLIASLLQLSNKTPKDIDRVLEQAFDFADTGDGPLLVELSKDSKQGEAINGGAAQYAEVSNFHRSLPWFVSNLNYLNLRFLELSLELASPIKIETELNGFNIEEVRNFQEDVRRYFVEPNQKQKLGKFEESSEALPKIFVSIPLWGEVYLSKFSKFVAPNLFSARNLEFLRSSSLFVFQFFTEEAFVEPLKLICKDFDLKNHEIQVIVKYGNDWLSAEDKYSGKKYERVTVAHAHSAQYCAEHGDYMIPFYGDMVVSETFMPDLFKKFGEGNGVIVVGMAPPVFTEGMIEDYSDDAKVVFSSKKLSSAVLKHLHGMIKSCVVHPDIKFNPLGPFIGTKVFDGFLFSSVHLHVVALHKSVFGEPGSFAFDGTIDGNWVYKFDINPLNIIALENFSDIPMASLMDADFPHQGNMGRQPVEFLVCFCSQEPNIFDNQFIHYRFLISGEHNRDEVARSELQKHSQFWSLVLDRLFIGANKTNNSLSIPDHAVPGLSNSLRKVEFAASPANQLTRLESNENVQKLTEHKVNILSQLIKTKLHRIVPKKVRIYMFARLPLRYKQIIQKSF